MADREFAVVLLDVRMPGLDGFETAARIRQRERDRHTPIIFITAEGAEEEDHALAYSQGAVDFLVKPFGSGGAVVGTMIHGLFENDVIREGLLETLRTTKGLSAPTDRRAIPSRDAEYDRLAKTVHDHIDERLLRRIACAG